MKNNHNIDSSAQANQLQHHQKQKMYKATNKIAKSREVSNFKDVSYVKTYALYTVSVSVCAASDTDIFTYLINSMQLFLFLFLLISKKTQ